VKIYVNGESQLVKILFDQNTEPFHKKNTPIRVGAGGGLRFNGSIGDARIYNRALSSKEAAALSVAEPLSRIPAAGRTTAQQAKLDLAFLETAARKMFARPAFKWRHCKLRAINFTILFRR